MTEQGESSRSHNDAEPRQRLTHPRQPGDVIVLDTLFNDDDERKENLKEDLWLSTVDGRFGSMPIPIRVGLFERSQTFYVRKMIIMLRIAGLRIILIFARLANILPLIV